MILAEKEINKISGGSVDYFDRIVFARAIESALLEKLRGGVELPEPAGYYEQEYIGEPSRIEARFDHDQLLQYGDARALAEREQTIEECLNSYSPDDTATDWADKIRALAASPPEQTPVAN